MRLWDEVTTLDFVEPEEPREEVSSRCRFFLWHDPAAPSFLRDLIGDLRDCCVKSKKENEMLKSELGDVEMQLLQTKQKLDEEEKKVVSLQNAKRTRNEMRSLKIFIFFS
ncbi:hypothetical protein BRADI_3g53341v3 [Brachypodium distachyon]|uniref:Uncharacterized protein n=1 Tax=Brachypodium distachyon TaxID=15368 RepID=A0A0Q3QH85_BRADI|nr:hypothetical protein BRADI_3g53341v3 [Brachypodium distachyon]